MPSVRKPFRGSLRARVHRDTGLSEVPLHGLREVAERDAQPLGDGQEGDPLNPLQFAWWMLTSDYTILIYTLVFVLLIALDIALHLAGIGG